ncbi:MAG: glycosyltransferase family 2 protein [Thermodesulfobacteriota bacterium]
MANISIIIRTRNEERWIASCLKAVFSQNCQDFEVIIVDNESTDATLAKVEQFPVKKVVHCTEYLPGKSLNIGIAEAAGEFIVCLSGHCIPTNRDWLGNLVRNFDDPEVAGVYGRQEPLSFTPPADKRDLLIVFGPERKVQRKDSFFHNANSMIRKAVLDRYPFDDRVTNIEDRVWAQQVLNQGFAIVYEPEASVYHYHGIHQNGNSQRCQNVVKILENLGNRSCGLDNLMRIQDLHIAALIPNKGRPVHIGASTLLECALNSARSSRYIATTVVSADREDAVDSALAQGADFAFLRDESLSHEYVGLEKVYRYTLERLEAAGVFPDIVVLLETTYPFRDHRIIDAMIEKLVSQGFDSLLPARVESNAIWIEEDSGLKRVDEGFVPRQFKKAVYLSFKGLCCVTRPEFLRSEEVLGPHVGMYQIDNPYACLEIRGESDFPAQLAPVLPARKHRLLPRGGPADLARECAHG